MSLLVVLGLRWDLGLGHCHPTVLLGGVGRSTTELGVFQPSPGASQGGSASPKSSSPEGWSRDLLDLLLPQVAQAFASDLPEQGPRQGAPQGQEPAEQLLHLGGTGREGRCSWEGWERCQPPKTPQRLRPEPGWDRGGPSLDSPAPAAAVDLPGNRPSVLPRG